MSRAAQFCIHDPVKFRYRGVRISGHIARKTPQKADIVGTDGGEYRVPWDFLARNEAESRKRVTLRRDQLKALFRPEDEVVIPHGQGRIEGTVARLGPKRALVATEHGSYYVPYGLLTRAGPDPDRGDGRRLAEVAAEAERLMSRHGLTGWSFQFEDASKQAGVCVFGLKVIGLSRLYCLYATDRQVRDTILHEIAHALVGPKHNHDATWKAVARSIGCAGDRCHKVEFAPPRYIARCATCGWAIKRFVRKRGAICKACRTPVSYITYTKKRWELATNASDEGKGACSR